MPDHSGMSKKGANPKFDSQWAKAKELCRLNMEDIRMAKELGMSPKSLMKNIPSPSQRWKAPVRTWIRELYEKRFGNKRTPPQKANPPAAPSTETSPSDDDDVPF
jgi:hypothetical protein